MGQLSRGLHGLCAKAEIVKGDERLESALTRSHMLAKLYMRKSLLLERDTRMHKRKSKSDHW